MQYVEELEKGYTVEDALQFPGITGDPDEWSNIPQLTARYCVRLTQHLAALVKYNKDRSAEETSASLREFVEDSLQHTNKAFKDFRKDAEYKLDLARKRHGDSVEYLDRVDKDLSLFKNYCDDMKLTLISELFHEHLQEDDLKNDNEQEYTPDVKNYTKIDPDRLKDVL